MLFFTYAAKYTVFKQISYASVAIAYGHQNCHNLKENVLKYMNNSIRTLKI